MTSVPGTINNQALQYLQNIDVSGDAYVICQTGTYTTCLFYGDGLSYDGSGITGYASYVEYDQRGYSVSDSSGRMSYYPTISYGSGNISVDTDISLYYTNLIDYSPRQDGGLFNDKITVVGFALSCILVFLVLSSLCRHAIFRMPSRLR